MIVTVTLNPAIDISYQVPNFQLDRVHRAEAGNKTAGGKGLNVSRVLKQLGEEPLLTGFLGGKNGEWIQHKLSEENFHHAFVAIAGETRQCLAILDTEQNNQTEILEKGPVISELEIEQFENVFQEFLKEAEFVVASGSLPRGIPSNFYAEMGKWANSANVPFILDTSGEALVQGIEGKPFLIKPNRDELEQYANKENLELPEIIEVAKSIIEKGVQHVLVTLGADGAILVTKEHVWQAQIPTIEVVNAVGSGDSTVAGMVYALKQGYELPECLKWACACGMANALEEATGSINRKNVDNLLGKIQVKEI